MMFRYHVNPFFPRLKQRMSQPYLFYSERCPHSKQIIETLKGLNKSGLYKFVLVESLARTQIPAFLKKVPTLYVPDSKEVLVGKDIFGYISKPTNSRKELPTKGADGVPTGAAPVGDVSAWGFEGSSRLSEAYSSWDTPTTFSSDGNGMYTFLNGPVASSPNAPTEAPAMSADVSARLEALQNERKNEFSGIKRS
jgi:glutaredoxin-related protein